MASFVDKYFWWLPLGHVPEITPEELKREISRTRNRPQLLDVRTRKEWREAAIKNSVLVPVSILKSRINALPFDKKKPVVCICRSAHRSIPAVRLLRLAGYENVRHLKGGMLAWQARNYHVIEDRDR
jgi:rhodanese-related sulfurtransferase